MKKIYDMDDHRISVPNERWIMIQTWKNLLFAHYPVPKSVLRPLLPSCFELDTYDSTAWISIVPFQMSTIHIHGLSKLPLSPTFDEINVRTYVNFGGKPGVYFFSLDANNKLAVFLANMSYNLPYMDAKIQFSKDDETVKFHSERTDSRVEKGVFSATYSPIGDVFTSIPGSLDYWLTERYVFFVIKKKKIYEGNIYHQHWPLQHAKATIKTNTVARCVGIRIENSPAILHYCEKLDILAWIPKKVGFYHTS